jgi:hypothetical protein
VVVWYAVCYYVGSRTAFERIARSGVLCPASCGARYAHPKNARGKLCVFI